MHLLATPRDYSSICILHLIQPDLVHIQAVNPDRTVVAEIFAPCRVCYQKGILTAISVSGEEGQQEQYTFQPNHTWEPIQPGTFLGLKLGVSMKTLYEHLKAEVYNRDKIQFTFYAWPMAQIQMISVFLWSPNVHTKVIATAKPTGKRKRTVVIGSSSSNPIHSISGEENKEILSMGLTNSHFVELIRHWKMNFVREQQDHDPDVEQTQTQTQQQEQQSLSKNLFGEDDDDFLEESEPEEEDEEEEQVRKKKKRRKPNPHLDKKQQSAKPPPHTQQPDHPVTLFIRPLSEPFTWMDTSAIELSLHYSCFKIIPTEFHAIFRDLSLAGSNFNIVMQEDRIHIASQGELGVVLFRLVPLSSTDRTGESLAHKLEPEQDINMLNIPSWSRLQEKTIQRLDSLDSHPRDDLVHLSTLSATGPAAAITTAMDKNNNTPSSSLALSSAYHVPKPCPKGKMIDMNFLLRPLKICSKEFSVKGLSSYPFVSVYLAQDRPIVFVLEDNPTYNLICRVIVTPCC